MGQDLVTRRFNESYIYFQLVNLLPEGLTKKGSTFREPKQGKCRRTPSPRKKSSVSTERREVRTPRSYKRQFPETKNEDFEGTNRNRGTVSSYQEVYWTSVKGTRREIDSQSRNR